MAKSIFEQIEQGDSLAKTWNSMQTSSVPEKQEDAPKQVNESKEETFYNYTPPAKEQDVVPSGVPVNESRFNKIYEALSEEYLEECGDGSCGCDKKKKKESGMKKKSKYSKKKGGKMQYNEMDRGMLFKEHEDAGMDYEEESPEDFYEEDDMISAPIALVKELMAIAEEFMVYAEDPMGSEDETEIDQEEFEQLEESSKSMYKMVSGTEKYSMKKPKVEKLTNDKWKFLCKSLDHYTKGKGMSYRPMKRKSLFNK